LSLNSIHHKSRLKSFSAVVFISFCVVFLSVVPLAMFFFRKNFLPVLFFFYTAAVLVAGYWYMVFTSGFRRVSFSLQDIQESINVLKEGNEQERQSNSALLNRIQRYKRLKEIIEEINNSFDLESAANSLLSASFSLIGSNKGVCVLYLFDKRDRMLKLFKTRKEDKKLVIKTKTGDIFDEWVVRHLGCLLVEDSRKDFRFDLSKPVSDSSRPVGSLISAPLISNNILRGILRLDNPEPGFYNVDDLRLLMTVADIGAVALENDELYRKTKELAIHDGLTQLYTKGYFLERLKEECKRSLRQDRVLSLLLIDLDFFKKYNDEFGHPAGDIVLQKVSAMIADFSAEKNALVCRFGGEEFCVVFFGLDKGKALNEAEEMRRQIEEASFVLRNVPTRVTLSIGVASFPGDAENETELMIRADKALYDAKESGRNRVSAYKGKQ